MSQNIFRNYKLSDDLISFWYKARHNVLPCYYTQSLWYTNQSATCVLNGYSIESTAHVLNGCSKLKNNYSKRHDRIVEKIGREIRSRENKVIVNKTVRTALRESGLRAEITKNDLILNSTPENRL